MLPKHDIALLFVIGEYRVVTIRQLAAISERSCQVVRRRIRSLENQGLIIKKPFGYGKNQGRPEEIIYLSSQGIDVLSEKGLLSMPINCRQNISNHHIDHELLANWFYIHWKHMEKVIPYLSFTSVSSQTHSAGISSLLRISIPGNEPGRNLLIIPDGILTVKHKENGKALLFILEVDMDSETLSGRKRNTNTIQHKILCYRELFRQRRYKSFEKTFDATFNGFRVLFLAATNTRVASLCRFVQTLPDTDFIWLADQSQMFECGLSSNIWVRGGKYEDPRESILGSKLSIEAPLMAHIR